MKKFESEFDKPITPSEYIKLMYKYTNDDGILYFPDWIILDEPSQSLRCKIEWNENDVKNAINEVSDLIDNIKKIAEIYEEAGDDITKLKKILTDHNLYKVWETYIQRFVYDAVSQEEINDIRDKVDTINEVKNIKTKMLLNKPIGDYERELYEDYKDLELTKKENDIYEDYLDKYYDNVYKRVGDNVAASKLVLCAQRLCKLFQMGPPEFIINNEACSLAKAYVVHKYASKIDEVSDIERYRVEKLYDMSEEEQEEYLDLLYRPKKKNNRKHNLNLFVYLILKKYSNNASPLSQNEILKILRDEYELEVERKSLSRAIHDIEDEQLGVFSDPKKGVYYDPNKNSHENRS